MFEDISKNILMLKGSYRKLKSYYYYNKNFILMRKKLAEFEYDHEQMEKTFEELAMLLCHPRSKGSKKLLSQLLLKTDFYVIPKKFERPQVSNNKPVANTLPRDKKMKNVNFFIDAPIEVYILDTLWTVFLAKMDNDKKILSFDVYGNTINKSALFQNDDINFENRTLFNRYFNKYTDWRNNAFDRLERNYDSKKDSLLISLDIKSYFYSIAFNFAKMDEYFKNHELLTRIKVLTNLMRAVYKTYLELIKQYRKDLSFLKTEEYPLPIGLFSSMVIGNIYLNKFDTAIRKETGISYYGRYVDDILFVIDRTISPNHTNATILKEVFVDTNILVEKEDAYYIKEYPNLCIQADKVKILYIDHQESKAIIDIYNDTIRIIPSQMNPLPESNLSLNPLNEVAYTVENFTKENKIRDIGGMGIDAFKVGKFFSNLAHRYAHIDTMKSDKTKKEIDDHIEQIEKFFTGSQGVEFYANWLNYMYFLVVTRRNRQLQMFISNTKKRITELKGTSLDKTMYNNLRTINRKVKEALQEHLKICLCLALSIDSDMAEKHFGRMLNDVTVFRESNLFEHNFVALPLANFLEYKKSVSYSKMDLNEMGDYPEKIEESFKFIWSPRFIHYDELLLLLFYHYHRQNKNGVTFKYIVNGLTNKFEAVNHIKFETFEIGTYKPVKIDDYSIRKIAIPPFDFAVPEQVNIAVGSLNISLNKCLEGCNRWTNITLEEKELFFDILRQSYECFKRNKRGTMILVLPELCYPIYWIRDLIKFAKQTQIGIVTGLQYLGDGTDRKYNYIATILPFNTGKRRYNNAFLYIREKNDYSPIEYEELKKMGFSCKDRDIAEYQVFSWKGVNLSPLVCFEMTDVMVRALLKGRCDIIAASVFNPDTTYFSNIIDSTARDLHTYIVQANTSYYGDSRVTGPYDRDSKDVFKIKGGDNDHVVIGTIDFKRLKDYQRSYKKSLEKRLVDIERERKKKKPNFPQKDRSKPNIKPLSARFKNK